MIFRFVCFLLLCIYLSGCGTAAGDKLFGKNGWFRDRGDDYLKAEAIDVMRVPAGVGSIEMAELFYIPPIADNQSSLPEKFELMKPSDFSFARKGELVKVQDLDNRSWIVVNQSPSHVWPRVRNFLSRNHLPVGYIDATTGTIETDWLSLPTEPQYRDRYRIQMEQGLHNNSTEIHITQLTAYVTDIVALSEPQKVNWPAYSINPSRELWLVNKMSEALNHEEKASASLLAQAIGSSRKVALFLKPEDPHLMLYLDYKRAWNSVKDSFRIDSITLNDMHKSKGVFRITLTTEQLQT
ncbi:MAG: outer membrane protein assembly factor BamC, partial [Pseudomonadales bacterium]|nr:outer membrane protein assembly factor BamC [Pseudomonadales bacterium]